MALDLSRAADAFGKRFADGVLVVDSHTAGETTRLIVDGFEPPPGATMAARRRELSTHQDHIRQMTTREPRGHRDLLAALVTEPASDRADFGLIFMDARRYPYLCGHATIGAVTTLLELGLLTRDHPETQAVVVDTPSGPITARVKFSEHGVEAVALEMVPTFVGKTAQPLTLPNVGQVLVDLVCAGGFFVMVEAGQLGIDLAKPDTETIVALGMAIIRHANEAFSVSHPTRPEVGTIDVAEIYDRGRSAVVYGERHLDRSPCGTGTTAKVALLHHRGKLAVGDRYDNHGPLGTTFQARLLRTTTVGTLPAVVVEISGSAHIVGMSRLVVSNEDPLPTGFLF